MALPVHSIGEEVFLSMSRPPAGPKDQKEVEARAGVAGVDVWGTGVRGEPFQVRTVVDCTDLADAETKFRAYEALTQSLELLPIVWCDQEYDFSVLVLNVDVVDGGMRKVLGGVGGVAPNGGALLTCVWDLIAIVPPEEAP